ncbi:aldo/keto reductase [Candidatus Roizmanbacteria bacterium RIFCSPLOWO2_01_FULL_38_11]|uniref:Aldo/keto reductase n=1 Tax=Candidatus Roizmanbacteria bacterium RIFCSPLOWO2_01_FULL_38_11 TaxID=1802060 RepID=A0A1F7IKE9_9BACT|nr:MAG: aldo/keto reductase [Candidatus Roizmanbacteria bacterium RIFCSPLOWO2_01_FULL_38_11]
MNYRTFGRTGWKVSEIGHGMWGMGSWKDSDDKTSLEALHRSVELGINFFDTAWIYGNGRSEKLLGQLIKAHPNKGLYTVTKIPPKNMKWPAEPWYNLNDTFPYEHIIEYTEKSLKNLGLEKIDLILFHVWDDAWAENDQWQKAVDDLKKRGLIQAFGISIDRWEPENVIKAIGTGLIDAVEVIYNIFDQAPEDVLLPLCREKNIATIARVPLDEGSLTGTLTAESTWQEGDWRNTYFTPKNLSETLPRIDSLMKLLPSGMTLPELALRFILSNPDIGTTIPGMRKTRNVETNISASEKGKLDTELINELRKYRWDRKSTPKTRD